jgi:hypothetical protein
MWGNFVFFNLSVALRVLLTSPKSVNIQTIDRFSCDHIKDSKIQTITVLFVCFRDRHIKFSLKISRQYGFLLLSYRNLNFVTDRLCVLNVMKIHIFESIEFFSC